MTARDPLSKEAIEHGTLRGTARRVVRKGVLGLFFLLFRLRLKRIEDRKGAEIHAGRGTLIDAPGRVNPRCRSGHYGILPKNPAPGAMLRKRR